MHRPLKKPLLRTLATILAMIVGTDHGFAAAHRYQSELSKLPDDVQRLITSIVAKNIPNAYVDKKHWGQTKEVTRGVSLHRDGLRIRAKRKKKSVNHGTWRMYRITQIDPDQNVHITVTNIREAGNGKTGFQVGLTSKLRAFARVSRWNRGVQIVSVSTDAEARIHLQLSCEVSMKMVGGKLPPDIVVQPKVTAADLQIVDFRVERISKLDGKLAREVGRGLQKVLERKIEEKREKLPEKINRQIAKNEDKLRFSLHDIIVTQWASLTEGIGDSKATSSKESDVSQAAVGRSRNLAPTEHQN